MRGAFLRCSVALALSSGLGSGAQEVTGTSPDIHAEPSVLKPRAVFDHPFALEEIEATLAALAAAHPRFTELETIGTSRVGRAIQVLAITDASSGAASEKPALWVVDRGSAEQSRGAEAALALARELVESAESDPETAALLARTALYVAPALAPDRRLADASKAGEGTLFERNFPIGWRPERLRPGSGALPLSEPETRAAAQFLERHPNVVVVIDACAEPDPARASARTGFSFPAADAEELAALSEAGGSALPRLRAWDEGCAGGGSLLDFAYQAHGMLPLALDAGGALPIGADLERFVVRFSGLARGVLLRLPRVRIVAVGLEPLGPGQWQLDLAVENHGALASASTLGLERGTVRPLELGVEGARLLACAERHADEALFKVRSARSSAVWSGRLDGGEVRWIRLVLEGEAGGDVAVVARSPWSGRVELTQRLE